MFQIPLDRGRCTRETSHSSGSGDSREARRHEKSSRERVSTSLLPSWDFYGALRRALGTISGVCTVPGAAGRGTKRERGPVLPIDWFQENRKNILFPPFCLSSAYIRRIGHSQLIIFSPTATATCALHQREIEPERSSLLQSLQPPRTLRASPVLFPACLGHLGKLPAA